MREATLSGLRNNIDQSLPREIVNKPIVERWHVEDHLHRVEQTKQWLLHLARILQGNNLMREIGQSLHWRKGSWVSPSQRRKQIVIVNTVKIIFTLYSNLNNSLCRLLIWRRKNPPSNQAKLTLNSEWQWHKCLTYIVSYYRLQFQCSRVRVLLDIKMWTKWCQGQTYLETFSRDIKSSIYRIFSIFPKKCQFE